MPSAIGESLNCPAASGRVHSKYGAAPPADRAPALHVYLVYQALPVVAGTTSSKAGSMASADAHGRPPEGRLIPISTPDVHVEARRLGAALLDFTLLLILQVWTGDVFGVTTVTGGSPIRSTAGYAFLTTRVIVDLPYLMLLAVAYFSLQEALFGATWGKLLAGLRVVDTGGRRPVLGAVLVRNIVRLVDAWPLLFSIGVIGIVAALTSPRRQRLGDRVAGTLVVRATSAPLAYLTPRQVRRRLLALVATLAVVGGGCLAFSYWGRPPLVIEGLAHTANLIEGQDIVAYSLGTPTWGPGAVTYPIAFTLAGQRSHPCSGAVRLRWAGFFQFKGGWVLDEVRATSCR